MEIVSSKSMTPDKQFDARIYNKQRFYLDRQVLQILET